jgi:hypothetical protein
VVFSLQPAGPISPALSVFSALLFPPPHAHFAYGRVYETFEHSNVETFRRALPSSASSSKFRIPQLLCLPLLRRLPACVGILPVLELFTLPQGSNIQTCGRSNALLIYPLSFQTLAHSFAPSKDTTLLFSSASALFAKNHPGWGEGGLPFFDVQTFRRFNVQTIRQSHCGQTPLVQQFAKARTLPPASGNISPGDGV